MQDPGGLQRFQITVYIQMTSQDSDVRGIANVRMFSKMKSVIGAPELQAFRIAVPEVRNCPVRGPINTAFSSMCVKRAAIFFYNGYQSFPIVKEIAFFISIYIVLPTSFNVFCFTKYRLFVVDLLTVNEYY